MNKALVVLLLSTVPAGAQSLNGYWAQNPDDCFTAGDNPPMRFGNVKFAPDGSLVWQSGKTNRVQGYEWDCELSGETRRGKEVTFNAACAVEGDEYKGVLKAVFDNQWTMRVTIPDQDGPKKPFLFVRCGQLTRKDIQDFKWVVDGKVQAMPEGQREQ